MRCLLVNATDGRENVKAQFIIKHLLYTQYSIVRLKAGSLRIFRAPRKREDKLLREDDNTRSDFMPKLIIQTRNSTRIQKREKLVWAREVRERRL